MTDLINSFVDSTIDDLTINMIANDRVTTDQAVEKLCIALIKSDIGKSILSGLNIREYLNKLSQIKLAMNEQITKKVHFSIFGN